MSVCGEFGRRRSKLRSPARAEAQGRVTTKEGVEERERKGPGIVPILIGLGVLLAVFSLLGGGRAQ